MKTFIALILAGTLAAGRLPAESNAGLEPIPSPPNFRTGDPEFYGRQLAQYADLYDSGWRDEVLRGTMTLFDAGGDSVSRSFTRMVREREQADQGDKIVIKFLSPAEIKGVSALTFENPGNSDDNWLWLPANKRVRRISGANNTASFQGTEFTYEDLGSIDPSEYEWRFLEQSNLQRSGETVPVYKLQARPTYQDTGYRHIVVYLHPSEWRQERIEYYDKAGRLLKTRDSTAWQQLHGRFWRPARVEMRNHQTGKRTVLEQSLIMVGLHLYTSERTGEPRANLGESLFTTASLAQ